MALARAIVRAAGGAGSLADFVASARAKRLRILEVNEAGALSPILARAPGHRLRVWPEVDLLALDEPDESLDVIVHSDTLEHVPDPVAALAECRRALRPGGFVAYTVPMVPGRQTRSRRGLPPSWHGSPQERGDDFLVWTEYGGDAWRDLARAGFDDCRIEVLEHPDAHAFVGVRGGAADTIAGMGRQAEDGSEPGDGAAADGVRDMPERARPGMGDVSTLSQHVIRYGWALQHVGGLHVLDLGCGTGYGSEILTWAARSVHGFDLWRPGPGEVPAWPGDAQLHWGHDLANDELPRANAGVMFEVLEHLTAPEAALRRVFAAVDLLLLSFPNPRWYGSQLNPHHVTDWTLDRLELEVGAAARAQHGRVELTRYAQRIGSGGAIVPGADADDDFWLLVVRTAERRAEP
jgi:2-polyprenyl-3-methyl-5-hydroxy-6-metoxy-1,4-benzoquinol methylase